MLCWIICFLFAATPGAVLGSLRQGSHYRHRRLDADYEALIPPYINEIDPDAFDDLNTAIELASVDQAPIAGFDRRLEDRTHWFGDRVQFFAPNGTYLGAEPLSVDNSTDITLLDITDLGQVSLAVLQVPKSKLPAEGGILCYYGFDVYDFTRVLAYGNVNPNVKLTDGFSNCQNATIDELISDDTSLVAKTGQSYQRTGFGVAPEDFTWTVAPSTLGEVNAGQEFPQCTSVCGNGRYNIQKTGFFGRCHTKCNREFFVNIRIRFFHWECGTCDN